MKSDLPRTYDLDERLLSYGASIINLTRVMTSDYAGRHVGNQLLRAYLRQALPLQKRVKNSLTTSMFNVGCSMFDVQTPCIIS
jgi:hypothetical protein